MACPLPTYSTTDGIAFPWAFSDVSDFWKNSAIPLVFGLVTFSARDVFLPLRDSSQCLFL